MLLVILQGVSSDNLHCYNEQVKPTPGFDQLAERGVRLTQFQLTAAESAADGTGLWENASSPGDRRSWSLVAHLWQEGYSTALIGDCSGLTSDPRERGFDHWYGFRTQADASAQFPTSVLSNGRRLEVVSNTKQPTVSATEILLEEAAAHQAKMSRQRPVATIVSLRLQGLTVSEQDDVASRLLSKLDQRRFGSSTAMIVVGVPESAERRRPFFAVWPGHLPAGSTWTEVTTFADATATLLEIAESPRRQSKPRGVSQLQNWRGLEPAD